MTSPPRLALAAPLSLDAGGIARCSYFLADALVGKNRLETRIALGPLYPAWAYPGSQPKTNIDTARRAQWPHHWAKLRTELERGETDTLIIPYWTRWHAMGTYWLSRSRKYQTIGIFHNFIDHDSTFPAIFSRQFLKSFAGILCHCAKVESQIRAKGFQGPISVIAEPPPPTLNLTQSPKASDCLTHILFSGLLRPYKGADLLVNSLHALRALPWRATIHGSPWRKQTQILRNKIQKLGLQDRVTLIDAWLSEAEVNVLFQASDLVVLPYRKASGSGVLARALAFQKPVVVTKTGNLATLAEKHQAGWTCEPEDQSSLTRAIEAALDPIARESVKEKLQASQFANWNDYADAIWNLAIELRAGKYTRSH